jgi:nitrate/TMAO reductase-like tetraheme cytochrome c subunit
MIAAAWLFVNTPLGRWAIGAALVAAIVAGIYFKGSFDAKQAEVNAATSQALIAVQHGDAAVSRYNGDGTDKRLHDGNF